MKIPDGMTEEQVLSTIDKVAKRLAYKYKFGYHEVDDIRQQAFILALEGLEEYDSNRPLENFLWTHIRNRLFNNKRNKFARPDPPCNNCPLAAYIDNKCTAYYDMMECKHYRGWMNRNTSKQNIMLPIELSDVEDENEDNMKLHDSPDEIVELAEIIDILDKNLEIHLRKDWIMMRTGVKIPKPRRVKLQAALLEIMQKHGINPEKTWKIE